MYSETACRADYKSTTKQLEIMLKNLINLWYFIPYMPFVWWRRLIYCIKLNIFVCFCYKFLKCIPIEKINVFKDINVCLDVFLIKFFALFERVHRFHCLS